MPINNRVACWEIKVKTKPPSPHPPPFFPGSASLLHFQAQLPTNSRQHRGMVTGAAVSPWQLLSAAPSSLCCCSLLQPGPSTGCHPSGWTCSSLGSQWAAGPSGHVHRLRCDPRQGLQRKPCSVPGAPPPLSLRCSRCSFTQFLKISKCFTLSETHFPWGTTTEAAGLSRAL